MFLSQRQESIQRAARAVRICFTAEVFAGVDDEGMELVEELVIGGERGFEEIADFVVGEFGMGMAVAFEDAASIGVDDEDRMFAGVEKNGVGGFRADAAEAEELNAKDGSWRGEQFVERTVVSVEEEFQEGLESFGFLAKVAGGAEELRELSVRSTPDGSGRK